MRKAPDGASQIGSTWPVSPKKIPVGLVPLHRGLDGCPSGLPLSVRRRHARGAANRSAVWGTADVAATHSGRQFVTHSGRHAVKSEVNCESAPATP
jgi:hypothetical protein